MTEANTPEAAIRLNIGCGGNPLPGYINVDMNTLEEMRVRYPEKKFEDDLIIQNLDVFALPYADGTVDEVRADSFIEHLSFEEEPKFLGELKRVLKPGGRFVFSVPDFEAVARIWLDAEDDWKDFYRTDKEAIESLHWFGTHTYEMKNRWGYLTAIIYGSQNGEGQYHKNCYTEGKLRAIFSHLGFRVEKLERFAWKGDRDPMLGGVVVKQD